MTKAKSIITIAGERGILLLQESNGWYKTTCCRHNDIHPTLRISPDGSYWLCFACRKGGDVTAFVRWCDPSISNDAALAEVYGDSNVDWAIVKALECNDANDYANDEAGAKLFYEAMKLNLLDKDRIDAILMSESSLNVLENLLCS